MINKIQHYLIITKPRIVLANIISVISGFIFYNYKPINYSIFFATIISTSLIISSACIFNNYIDKDIDQIMERTKKRQLALISIKPIYCFIYAIILVIIGIAILYIATNIKCVLLSISAFINYVIIYSIFMKRKSIYAILIGSFSGAIPPIIGCYAANNQNNISILILFLIFSLWQMPHSYAIGIFRLQDYQKANIPILPLIKGILLTKIHILIFILLFTITTSILFIINLVGYKYIIITTITNLWWLIITIYGFKKNINDTKWAKKNFFCSLIVINIFNIMLLIDKIDNITLQ